MFEPSRLGADHLADAYCQLVPLRSRKKTTLKPDPKPEKNHTKTATRRRS